MARHLSVLLLLASACLEPTLSKFEQPPVVVIQLPGDGGTFDEGAPIEFVGKVADDGPVTDLLVSWIDNAATVLSEGMPPDAEGFVRFTTADLAVGPHAIALRAVDTDNLSHEASVGVTVVDVVNEPSLTIVHPTTLEEAEASVQFLFEVNVSDPQDPPEDLQVELASDLDGDVCTMAVGSDGVGLCRAALRTVGDHRITFTAIDTDGNRGTKSTILPVNPVPEEPLVVVVAPMPGQGVLQDAIVEFRATVSDRQDVPQALAVDLSSDVEGFLCPLSVDAAGNAVCFQSLHIMGNQFLTFRAVDPDGNEAEGVVLVRVTDSSGIDDDHDGYAETQGDCDDTDSTVFPGALELADGQDNDCDGYADEGTVLADDDGDGYCESLSQPCTDGAAPGDCDDAAPAVHPGATEICGDGIDNNCDGSANEPGAVGCLAFYFDADADNYGDMTAGTQCLCTAQGPWRAYNDDDCNDSQASVYPGAPEVPDGFDNDCDLIADEGTVLYDDDGDGYCESATIPCTVGSGGGDCDDSRGTINPGATEYCADAFDSDCDGTRDDPGAVGCTTWYTDSDGDGYGGSATSACLCTAPPSGVLFGGDCDDSNPLINPTGAEIADGLDNNCNGQKDEGTTKYDDDGDGYCEAANCTLQTWQSTPWLGGDCNDGNPAVSPAATEICGNGVDDNCNGQQDEGIGSIGCSNYYQDGDGDGYGGGAGRCYCRATAPYLSASGSDCYDANDDAHPGQTQFFTGHRGDGSYDYDCASGVEKKWDKVSVCELSTWLLQLVCDQEQDGWLDDVPACGATDTWVTDCSYVGTGVISDLLACFDASNKVVHASQSRQQSCR